MNMVVKYALATILLTGLAPSMASARPVFPAAPRTSDVLGAAYTAASSSKVPIYPVDVRPSWRSLEPGKFVPSFKAQLALRPASSTTWSLKRECTGSTNFNPDAVGAARPVIE
jgi:hypothetical protein